MRTLTDCCAEPKRESNGVGCSAGPPSAIAQGRLSRKAREGAHPQLFRAMLKDKSALYFGVKVAHPPARANSITLGIHQVWGRNQFCFFLLLPTLARTT